MDTVPRWKICTGSAAGSFSAAIGKLYVQKHFDDRAKKLMEEMVKDIRAEFKDVLDKVGVGLERLDVHFQMASQIYFRVIVFSIGLIKLALIPRVKL